MTTKSHQPVPRTVAEAEEFFRCLTASCSLMGHACARRWRNTNIDDRPRNSQGGLKGGSAGSSLPADAGCIGCPAGEARDRLLSNKPRTSQPPAALTADYTAPRASKEEMYRSELERERLLCQDEEAEAAADIDTPVRPEEGRGPLGDGEGESGEGIPGGEGFVFGEGWPRRPADRPAWVQDAIDAGFRGDVICCDCGLLSAVCSCDIPDRDDPEDIGEVYINPGEVAVAVRAGECSEEHAAITQLYDHLIGGEDIEEDEEPQRVAGLSLLDMIHACTRAVLAEQAERDAREQEQLDASKKMRAQIGAALGLKINGEAPTVGALVDAIEREREERDTLRDEADELAALDASRIRLDAAIDTLERLTQDIEGAPCPEQMEMSDEEAKAHAALLAAFTRDRLKARQTITPDQRAHGVTAMLRQAEEEISRLAGENHMLKLKIKRGAQAD